jgi:hypothetical protein
MLENRERGYTFGLFSRRALKFYLCQIICYTVGIGIVVSMQVWPAVWCFLGMIVGSFVRDLAWLKVIRRSWPFSAAITDWDKVQKLADGEALD